MKDVNKSKYSDTTNTRPASIKDVIVEDMQDEDIVNIQPLHEGPQHAYQTVVTTTNQHTTDGISMLDYQFRTSTKGNLDGKTSSPFTFHSVNKVLFSKGSSRTETEENRVPCSRPTHSITSMSKSVFDK
jgi:hypothetical protein